MKVTTDERETASPVCWHAWINSFTCMHYVQDLKRALMWYWRPLVLNDHHISPIKGRAVVFLSGPLLRSSYWILHTHVFIQKHSLLSLYWLFNIPRMCFFRNILCFLFIEYSHFKFVFGYQILTDLLEIWYDNSFKYYWGIDYVL